MPAGVGYKTFDEEKLARPTGIDFTGGQSAAPKPAPKPTGIRSAANKDGAQVPQVVQEFRDRARERKLMQGLPGRTSSFERRRQLRNAGVGAVDPNDRRLTRAQRAQAAAGTTGLQSQLRQQFADEDARYTRAYGDITGRGDRAGRERTEQAGRLATQTASDTAAAARQESQQAAAERLQGIRGAQALKQAELAADPVRRQTAIAEERFAFDQEGRQAERDRAAEARTRDRLGLEIDAVTGGDVRASNFIQRAINKDPSLLDRPIEEVTPLLERLALQAPGGERARPTLSKIINPLNLGPDLSGGQRRIGSEGVGEGLAQDLSNVQRRPGLLSAIEGSEFFYTDPKTGEAVNLTDLSPELAQRLRDRSGPTDLLGYIFGE